MSMKQWESKVVHERFVIDVNEEIQKFLNKMGKDGWEPVSVFPDDFKFDSDGYTLVFKREIPEPKPPDTSDL